MHFCIIYPNQIQSHDKVHFLKSNISYHKTHETPIFKALYTSSNKILHRYIYGLFTRKYLKFCILLKLSHIEKLINQCYYRFRNIYGLFEIERCDGMEKDFSLFVSSKPEYKEKTLKTLLASRNELNQMLEGTGVKIKLIEDKKKERYTLQVAINEQEIETLKAGKEEPKKAGRKKIAFDVEQYQNLKEQGLKNDEIADKMEISRSFLYGRLKALKEQEEQAKIDNLKIELDKNRQIGRKRDEIYKQSDKLLEQGKYKESMEILKELDKPEYQYIEIK